MEGPHPYLRGNAIGDEGAKALAKWKGRTLGLGGNRIGDAGAKALVKWSGTTLYIWGNNIGPEGETFLAENWEGISLTLYDNCENAEVRKRYEESVELLLNEHICKDVVTHVLCDYLN